MTPSAEACRNCHIVVFSRPSFCAGSSPRSYSCDPGKIQLPACAHTIQYCGTAVRNSFGESTVSLFIGLSGLVSAYHRQRKFVNGTLNKRRTSLLVQVRNFGAHEALQRQAAGSQSFAPSSVVSQHGRWCAFVITLQRRQDRLIRLRMVLSHKNTTLLTTLRQIVAVDGRQMTFDDPAVHEAVTEEALVSARDAQNNGDSTIIHSNGQLIFFSNHLTLGGIGCAMSHRLALQAVALHPSADWGLILEDDIIAAVPNAHEAIMQIIDGMPADWDAIFVGYHAAEGDVHPAAVSCDACLEVANVAVVHMDCPLWGLYAWVVRKHVATLLVQNAFPISGQVDHALSSWLVRERGRAYRVDPENMLFYSLKSEVAADSDIQTMVDLRSTE